MIDEEFLNSIKNRYKNLHPLVVHRSIEKACSKVELFDILESLPDFPFFWDDNNKKWKKTTDFYYLNKVKQIL